MRRSIVPLRKTSTSARSTGGSPAKKVDSSTPCRKAHWYCRYSCTRRASSTGIERFLMKASASSTRFCQLAWKPSARTSSAISRPMAAHAVYAPRNITADVYSISSHVIGMMSPKPTVVIVTHDQ